MSVVFDTNIFISAAFFTNPKPAVPLRHAARNNLILRSTTTLAELAATMERSKFDRYASLAARRDFVGFIYATVHVVRIERQIRACRDPKDDKFLDVAVNGSADTIVTGDVDLLALHPFEGISIVTPAAYLEIKISA